MRTKSFKSVKRIPMPVKLATLLLWSAAAAVVVFWGLKFAGNASQSLPFVSTTQPVQVNAQAMAKALGAATLPAVVTAPPVASRYSLLGVLAGNESGGGAAVIDVQGKGSKAVRVGEAVEEGLILQSLSVREAHLGPANSPASVVLQLPKPPIAAFN